MTVLRPLVAALVLGSALGISCYSEQLPPSNYRYACEGDAECNSDEVCRRGLCERPCTLRTATDDCPAQDGYVGCFNGACATTCAVGSDYCPAPYACIDLGVDLGGGGSPFGGSTDPVGLCGLECDDADNADLCPEGEVCFTMVGPGTCVVDCSGGEECPAGNNCLLGLCVPEGIEIPMDGSGGEGAAGPTDDSEVRR